MKMGANHRGDRSFFIAFDREGHDFFISLFENAIALTDSVSYKTRYFIFHAALNDFSRK